MKRRMLSLIMATWIALQPSLAVLAESKEETTVHGDGYTIVSHMDGSQTLTFSADIAGLAEGGKDTQDSGRAGFYAAAQDAGETPGADELPEVEVDVQGSRKEAEASLSCGDIQITFEAEAFAAEQIIAGGELPEMVQAALEPLAEALTEAPKETQTEAPKETQAQMESPKETQALTEPEKETEAPRETQAQTEAEKETTAPTEASKETEAPTEAEKETQVSEAQTDATEETESIETEAADGENPDVAQSESTAEPETEESESLTETETQSEAASFPEPELRYKKLSDGIKEEMILYGYAGGHRAEYLMDFGALIPVREGNTFLSYRKLCSLYDKSAPRGCALARR